jgi:inosine/xanthosine triphosphate pyrophosphatase family protein
MENRPAFTDPRDTVRWRVHEAYKVLQTPVVLDTAVIQIEQDSEVYKTEDYDQEQEDQFVKNFNGKNAMILVVVGYSENGHDIFLFEGSLLGKVGPPRGSKGFGWDKIFYPKGYTYSVAGTFFWTLTFESKTLC